jgi:chromate reductase
MLPLHVLGIAGSLRAASYNRALLRAAQELAPEGMTISRFELDDLPLYNEDL